LCGFRWSQNLIRNEVQSYKTTSFFLFSDFVLLPV
jgi:hypothetical protein